MADNDDDNNDESSLSVHGGEMRPALAINNRLQWAVTQESRGQDKYFENQAPGLMSPTLRRAEKSILS